MKHGTALILAFCFLMTAVSCGSRPSETTSVTELPVSESTESPAATDADTPETEEKAAENDAVFVEIGEYVTLMYNPYICDVNYTVEQGIGSKENISFTLTMKGDYRFDGWSRDNALCNVKDGSSILLSADTSFVFSASEEAINESAYSGRILILPNYSYLLTYHANGGLCSDGTEECVQSYSAVWYKCPSTLPEQGYFERDGYTLLEYNTEPDGSGYAVSLGSRIPMKGEAKTDLYCIWAKQNDASEFVYRVKPNGVTIQAYTGTSDTIVFPDQIEGVDVKAISSDFSSETTVKHIVLPKNLSQVGGYAFASLTELESLVMYDNLETIYDTSFNSASFTSLRINARLNLFRFWGESQTTTKLDRLLSMFYSDKKSFVVFGGSGSLEGIDSPQIVGILSDDYNYVNLASNANLSAAFYFDWMENHLEEGDIVLWIPEGAKQMLGDTEISERVWELNAGDYDIFRDIDISEYTHLFSAYVTYSGLHKSSQQSFEVFSLAYNIYGDWIKERVSPGNVYTYSFNFDCSAYTYMAGLVREMSSDGVRILFTYPGVDETAAGISQSSLENYFSALHAAYPEVSCISDYTTALTPHEMMYDSKWHFTREGAVYRTKKIAEDLSRYGKDTGLLK